MSAYESLRYLGGGYFGEVWLEKDNALNRNCAAKYIRRTLDLGERGPFAEAQAMVHAEHDHVVRIYSAEMDDGVPVIRMEYLPDGSISDRYGKHPLPIGDSLKAIIDACRGLEFLHTRGWLHRDLKPANLMLGHNGEVKLSDFGLACTEDHVHQLPIGYATHLPPESVSSGYIDSVAGDIYAMGTTLYRLVNGDVFFESQIDDDADLVDLIERGKLPRRDQYLPHIHKSLRRVINKALNVDPCKRYDSASEFRHAIESVIPKVSWREVGLDEGVGWDGRGGSDGWRARIQSTKRGKFSFKVERKTASGVYRALRSDSQSFDTEQDAIQFAAAVLDRIAAIGK
ncbi:serine/threonine protein kinase [Kribbella amoyensis]|uniref:non-specific serine/threonine protein kinase n=1 Tax=Kribbella amoyensis TaxID=996641 RepID=A0A561B3N7_9ACTN|nr:serine/threonine-protein kinase [Kribbella amoyensis]TWD73479.1 serine/threonine protein kinase [Kribbella amoyensis]